MKQLSLLEKDIGSNRSTLFRSRVLNNSNKIFINTKEVVMALNAISHEMGKVGSNINQLARHANIIAKNSGLSQAVLTDFNVLMAEYLLIEEELHVAFRHIFRLLSK